MYQGGSIGSDPPELSQKSDRRRRCGQGYHRKLVDLSILLKRQIEITLTSNVVTYPLQSFINIQDTEVLRL